MCFLGFYLITKNENKLLKLPAVKENKTFVKILTQLTIVMIGLDFATLHPWRIESFRQRFLDGIGIGAVSVSIGFALTIS